MATTYRYAWLAVLDGDGRRKLNDVLLSMDDVNPALTRQNAPGAVWMIGPPAFGPTTSARLSTSALSENIGQDPDIEVVMVSVPGDEKTMRDWIDTPEGRSLRANALSIQPWVYSATTA